MSLVPMIVKKTANGERAMDPYSVLLDQRIVIIDSEITEEMAGPIIAQLLYLDSINNKPITLQITCPGGSILAGLAIIDTIKKIKSEVHGLCIGYCASMGASILSQCTKRYITENAYVMIHQASSGTKGNIQDMKVSLEFTEKLNRKLAKMISESCGKTEEDYLRDTNRDKWMDADEALAYGIVDEIIKTTSR